MLGGHRQGFNRLLLLQMILPKSSHIGIGQIGLTQHPYCGFITAQSSQHRVLAAIWNAGVKNFNQQINIWQSLFDLFAGLVHMAGEPLNQHGLGEYCFI